MGFVMGREGVADLGSVGRPQYRRHLRVLGHERSQPVVVTCSFSRSGRVSTTSRSEDLPKRLSGPKSSLL